MRHALVCAVLLGLCVASAASAASAALPRAGTLVPGRSLGGVHLGETAREVRAALGSRYGVCLGCAVPTWYFTYRAFTPQGLAVELTGGRVSAVYTLWQPQRWTAPRDVALGAAEAKVTRVAGPLASVPCEGYDALVRDTNAARTAYYFVGQRLWGFGLMGWHESPCR